MYNERRNEKNNLIGYLRISDGANIPIATGNNDYQDVLKWIADGNTPSGDPDVLDKVKQAKITEYKTEGVRRIGLQVAEWNNYETVKLIASIWNMMGTPNAPQTTAKDIYVYVRDTAIPNVNALTTIATVQAIDVVNDVNWP